MPLTQIVTEYYRYFNEQNIEGMINLLTPDFHHYPNQGQVRVGKDLFGEFLQKMQTLYEEKLDSLKILRNSDYPSDIAASFMVSGVYKVAEPGFPPAKNQPYRLPAMTLFQIDTSLKLIKSVTTYYNVSEWVRQVSEC